MSASSITRAAAPPHRAPPPIPVTMTTEQGERGSSQPHSVSASKQGTRWGQHTFSAWWQSLRPLQIRHLTETISDQHWIGHVMPLPNPNLIKYSAAGHQGDRGIGLSYIWGVVMSPIWLWQFWTKAVVDKKEPDWSNNTREPSTLIPLPGQEGEQLNWSLNTW